MVLGAEVRVGGEGEGRERASDGFDLESKTEEKHTQKRCVDRILAR